MLSKCKHCGLEAIKTFTPLAGHRVECSGECSYTSGHSELKDAITEWEESNGVANNVINPTAP